MRMPLFALFLSLLLTGVTTITTAAAAEPTTPGFANFRVSTRSAALNQMVRVDFTTMPRQVEGVDIERVVSQALDASRLAGHWRPLGNITVTEHEKTKTINVGFTLLARKIGELPLPKIQLAWIAGNQIAEFGLVNVAANLLIGGEKADLPTEVTGIAGHLWGERLSDILPSTPKEQIESTPTQTIIRPLPGLELIYRENALGEAILITDGLTLERAKDSFLARWGAPQENTATSLTWILGWTRITATPANADGTATRLIFVREDIQAILDRARVQRDVFGVLNGNPQAPINDEAQRRSDAEKELKRVLGE